MNIIRLNSIGEPFAKSGQATPPSGGGTETSSMEYFQYGKGTVAAVAAYCQYIKFEVPDYGVKMIAPYSAFVAETIAAMNAETIAFGINLQEKIIMLQGGTIEEKTILSSLIQNNITEAELAAIPRLTKEQFYTI